MIPAKEIVAAAVPTTPVDGGSGGGGFVNPGATVEIDLSSSEAPPEDGSGNGGKDRRSSGESDA